MANLVPSINTKGFWSLKSPWTTVPATVYECVAIREFSDFSNVGEDVFELVYAPQGLSRSICDQDRANGVLILSLQSETEPTIYVPNSYLLAYPNQDNVAYSHVVLSLSLGAIADSIDLSFLKIKLSDMCTDVSGIVAEVHLHKAPSDQFVSAAQHYSIEAARQSAIKETKTDRAKLIEKNALIDELRQVIADYEAIIKANNLIP